MRSPRLFLLTGLSVTALSASPALLGFRPARVEEQLATEHRFDEHLAAADIRGWLEQLSAEPNHVGAPHDRANAELTLAHFRQWGWEAEIESFDVLCPAPRSIRLELLSPTRFVAQLSEPPVAGDPSPGQTPAALPPYNVFGADGDVTARLVYVNWGMPEDYDELSRRGIDVKDCIVLARYGGGWRGLKPKLAHAHGAVGCVIYSDPVDDGYTTGDVYPQGPARPSNSVQRGSVLDMSVQPGDPLTPGWGAVAGATRLPITEASTLPKIPVLAISYNDAQPLLAALGGPVVPAGWRGGLPLTYHYGPGPAVVHLAVSSDWKLQRVYDVIARLPGRERPDEWIIRGNHRDAWVYGAFDPLAGHAAMMAEAKAFGALLREGWRPRRTLVYCSWDGEEPGLLGSTEWVEKHADELRRKAALYVNSDTNSRGFLEADGCAAYVQLVNEVARDVPDPETGASVLDRLRARLAVDAASPSAGDEVKERNRLAEGGRLVPIRALGAGSDYTSFLHFLGVATLSVQFGGEGQPGGVYHSAYDTFDHYERFGDPGFRYGVVLAKTIGHLMLRAADSDALPASFRPFAEAVGRYVADLHQEIDDLRKTTDRQAELIASGSYRLAADPGERIVPPAATPAPAALDLSALDAVTARLGTSATRCDAALASYLKSGTSLNPADQAELDRLLQGMERSLLHPAGLPGRDWYHHLIYAPGLWTGYDVKTLPGVREALEERRGSDAVHYTELTAQVIDAYCCRLDRIATLLGAGPPG